MSQENVEVVLSLQRFSDDLVPRIRDDGVWAQLAEAATPFVHADCEIVRVGLPGGRPTPAWTASGNLGWTGWLRGRIDLTDGNDGSEDGLLRSVGATPCSRPQLLRLGRVTRHVPLPEVGMRISVLTLRLRAVLVAAVAAFVVLAVTAAGAQAKIVKLTGQTTVTPSSQAKQFLSSNGVSTSTVGNATASNGSFTFPIVAGFADTSNFTGILVHSGGLKFTEGHQVSRRAALRRGAHRAVCRSARAGARASQ